MVRKIVNGVKTCAKYVSGAFSGQVINAETGKVEQPVVHRQSHPVMYALGMCMCLFALALAFSVFTGRALADDDDITTTVTTLSGYWTAIKAVAIGVVLFVLGRRLLRKV